MWEKIYDAMHSDIEARMHSVIKREQQQQSTLLYPCLQMDQQQLPDGEADISVLQHSKDGLQIIFSTSRSKGLFDSPHG